MKIVLLFLSIFVCSQAVAQTNPDEAAVRASVNQLFEGMKKADSTMIKASLAPGARLQTVVNKQGNVSVQDEAISQFVTSVGKAKAGSLDERLSGMEIKIDGELATAWTPYSFYYNGQQSHCGVNAFTLVKLAGTWKILTIIDTRRKQNCP